MRFRHGLMFVAIGAAILIALTLAFGEDAEMQPMAASVTADSQLAAGEYIVHMGHCNDCHTSGYMQTNGQVDRSQWLTGVPLGWRGPWGTTYGINLRLFVQSLCPDDWVHLIRTQEARPPHPWYALRLASDADLKAMHAFIASLGPAGEMMPDYVPPDQEPKTPYVLFEPVVPGSPQ